MVVAVVMMGLPGAGKSAIADALGRSLQFPVFSVDPLEATLLRAGITREMNSGRAAYDLAANLLESQLHRGQSAIVDAVNALGHVREGWSTIAVRFDARIVWIECVCSDVKVHRSRLEGRVRNLPGFPEPRWSAVERRGAEFDSPGDLPRLVLDAVDSLEGNVQRALSYVADG